MLEHAPTLQLIGVVVLAVAAVAWTVVLMRLLRRTSLQTPTRRTPTALPALPRQRRMGPALESVELTPAEQDAFAGLARQLANG
ncbi:hypothetical protein [Streptomyces roseochromogenus]|uniref:Uncharacterized protein n=1 Tax=Streptomyces roseochromogenus subsp. oscitans DS 12.976 TaxID=1352936 RepID=V6K3C0_STRRC|nr:hypothetical protein [Streptomyces roseochromogenus]EST26660.1 hypothetical protein M878_26520 [Streptomyces roseochromogenus subsp. oscitans DS 12.976]